MQVVQDGLLWYVVPQHTNSLRTKKQTTKFSSTKFQKQKFVQVLSYSEFKDWRANSVDLDEVAHYETIG